MCLFVSASDILFVTLFHEYPMTDAIFYDGRVFCDLFHNILIGKFSFFEG